MLEDVKNCMCKELGLRASAFILPDANLQYALGAIIVRFVPKTSEADTAILGLRCQNQVAGMSGGKGASVRNKAGWTKKAAGTGFSAATGIAEPVTKVHRLINKSRISRVFNTAFCLQQR